MHAADIEQKVIAYLTLPKNKVSPWGRVCKDVGIPDALANEILHDLCERNILETQTMSLGRIVVNLSDNFTTRTSSNTQINRGFSGNIIGDNFSGNTIIIGDKNENKSISEYSNNQKQRIFTTPGKSKTTSFFKFIAKYWWALIIPIIAGIVLLLIEYIFFVR